MDDDFDIVDWISDRFGVQDCGAGVSEDDGILNSDGDPYAFVCVVKGGNKTFYNGVDDVVEASDYIAQTLYDSNSDPDGEGVWLVVAVVKTDDLTVAYPEYDRVGLSSSTRWHKEDF